MRYAHYLWVLPFLGFALGYQLLRSLYAPSVIKTPAIVGKSLQDAITLLSDHNLNARVLAAKEDTDLQPGTIISQSPSSGSLIKANQPVFIVLATQGKHAIPALIAQNKQDLENALKQSGLRYKIHTIESSYPRDCCIGQTPSAEQPFDAQTPIAVYLSGGSQRPLLMPQCKHHRISDVMSFLADQGMTAQIIHPSHCPDGAQCATGLVVDQRPLPGSLLTLNKEKPLRVQLEVSH